MELLQLHYFQTVARMEHMTNAAKKLHIAQPALSKTIARLEEELGVPLFDRQNRQIRLNPFGKAFLNSVETALSVLEEGRREVTDLAGIERGTIRIATTTLNRLSKALGVFREQYPEVNFRIVQVAPGSMAEMVRMLENGEVDLCFGAASLDHPRIKEADVLHAEVRLAVPHGHRLEERERIHLREARGEAFIEYKEGHPFRCMNDAFCESAGIQREVVCEVEEPSALSGLVAAGLGVAFMPTCKGDEETQAYTLIPIASPDCHRAFSLAWLESRYLPQAASRFREFLAEYFKESWA